MNPSISTGVKISTLNLYDLVSGELVKSVGLKGTAVNYKFTGSFTNTSNSSECLNRPILVQLVSRSTATVVRETTTTCSYEFNNVGSGNYDLYQYGVSPFYYTLNGKCYRNAGIAYGTIKSNYWINQNINLTGRTSLEIVENNTTSFTSGLAFPSSLCSGLMSTASAGLTGKTMLDTISWTNANEWGGELPSDTQDIVIDYPGFYDQLTIKLDLSELNEYCSINSCTSDVTTIRALLLADSTTMSVTGSGGWNVTSNLIVNGSMLLDVDSTATLSFGNLLVNGDLTIPEGKNPLIIINGNLTVTGTFNPGNSTIILNGTTLNTISAPLAEGDTVKKTVHFHNLSMNSDSTVVAVDIEIANRLTLNANVSVENIVDDTTGNVNTIKIASTSSDAISGTGNIMNGTLVRAIDQSTPAMYRFHTPGTMLEFVSSDSLPATVSLNRFANDETDTLYKAYKGGTVNDETNAVSLSNLLPNGNWTFTSTNYPNGETTLGGTRYELFHDGSPELRVNLSLGYDLAQLNGLDESALALVKNTSALRIINLADVDGDNVSDSDRVEQEWEVAVYRDTLLESNYVGTYFGNAIFLDDISFGKYILVPKDSTGWKMLARRVNASQYPESLATVEVFVPQGTVGEVSYTRYQVAVITASSEGHGTITPSGSVEITFNSNAEFTIVPDAGYRVNKLAVDGNEIDGEDSFTFSDVSENHTISASFVFDDSTTFRTIAYDAELSKIPAKLAFRNGRLQYPPNLSTAVEAVFKKLGRNGTSFVGIPQASRDSAKKYSWLKYRKPVEFRRMFTKEHTEVYYPIDSTKNRRQQLRGGLRPNRSSYNNKAWEQGILFKLNLLASQYNITPPNFGALVLDTNVTLFGRDLTGATLVDVGMYLDSVMTYWKKYGVDNVTAYGKLRDFITDVIKPINDGFSAPVTTANFEIDSVAVDRDRNIFAIKLLGVARASDTKLVRLVPGIQPAKIELNEGFENVPTEFALYQNYPNPFNPSTTIEFDLNVDSRVTLKVYNILGQLVTTLVDGETWETGNQIVEFDATNFASGVYFYRFEATSIGDENDINTFTDVKKMVLMK
ncbi:MAG: T9SS type A sorting domain-containing protein [Ignavibacteriae bacterium]|nr:T9SS type A sorting domain-containing protein [Ignavibacteriota bacterium]